MKISTALEKIDDRQLFVPAFQREYVWKRDDAKQLIDSLVKQYPTGTMLTWETAVHGWHRCTLSRGLRFFAFRESTWGLSTPTLPESDTQAGGGGRLMSRCGEIEAKINTSSKLKS